MGVTTFKITKNVRFVENYLIKQMGMTKKSFHRKAYDEFLKGECKIDVDLCIKDKGNPNYIVRPVSEQTFLEPYQKQAFRKIASSNHTSMSVVLFQALEDYCLKNADSFLQNIYSHEQ